MSAGILIVGHGSREPGANLEFEELVAGYRAARPGRQVAHAYVELARPPLGEALVELSRRADPVVVLPLFLFAAGHVKNDIPLALARARRDAPGVRFAAARPLGVDPILVDLAWARLEARLGPAPRPERTAVLVVGRGASDPDANGDFYKVARLLGEGRGFAWVLPCFIGITGPRVEEAIELAARARPERILVVPYFLFGGRLVDRLRELVAAFQARVPWIRAEVTPHLGGDERLFQLIDERAGQAVGGERALPCDTCQYRRPIAGVSGEVGGLKALLWSLRHGFTHTQAMPHVHAHRAPVKHVLVCGNADCADRGSVALLSALRREIKRAGRERDIRVTRTLCMGRCGEGPTMAVYPDGVWYRGVAEADARELVDEHLCADRLVGRLVDNIMQ